MRCICGGAFDGLECWYVGCVPAWEWRRHAKGGAETERASMLSLRWKDGWYRCGCGFLLGGLSRSQASRAVISVVEGMEVDEKLCGFGVLLGTTPCCQTFARIATRVSPVL